MSARTEEGRPDGEAPREPRAGRLPDFFIAGHQKCGTTALYLMLDQHPEIFMCPVKEPRFFAPDVRSRGRREGGSRKHPGTMEGYEALFAGAAPGQRAGEASPQYLRSREAPGLIAEACPEAKIIAILREPASFLRSFHLQAVHNDLETETDFGRALELEAERREGRSIPPRCPNPSALLYSDFVHYTEQLRRFHEAFGEEQVLVLIYDDFRTANEEVVRTVLRFLEVDETLPLRMIDTPTLPSVRLPSLHRLAGAMRVAHYNPEAAGRGAQVLRSLVPGAVRNDRMRARWRSLVYGAPPPAADRELMAQLRRRFKPEVQSVGEYLGRDLVSLWGYDRLDGPES